MYDTISQGILLVMIAHNELDKVKINTKILREELKEINGEIIVVDNCSEDGLKEWLITEKNISYIIYDEKMMGYGKILGDIRREFGVERDILVLRANYFFTPGSIARMKSILDSNEDIAAVGPVSNIFPGEQKCCGINTYEEALGFQKELATEEFVKTVYIDMDVMLIKASTFACLQEDIDIPQAVMREYMKSVLEKKYAFAVCKGAVCFAVGATNDEPYSSFEPHIYKREKLHQLLYSFGDVTYQGVHLYKYIEPDILVGINNQNRLQKTEKNIGILMWNTDEIRMSTEEEAKTAKETIDNLPEKDVLFFTLPMRRVYQGKRIHTAIETFIASIDPEKYIDIELVPDIVDEYFESVPTKNIYPLQVSAISKLYGVEEVDRQELLEFLWVNFVHPLETILDIKIDDNVLLCCLNKAVVILKKREAYIKAYKAIIEKVKPKVIIYSHGQDMQLTYLRDTTLELGIPTLEIDHGVGTVDTYHKHLVYGDYLVVYSDIVAEKCRILGNDRVLGIGKPGAYDNINKEHSEYALKVITFVSSLECELWEYAKNLAKKLEPDKYLIVYKAHSAELWTEAEKKEVEETFRNLVIMEGTIDIRDLVNMSDVVVGIRSSAIFDALPYPMVKIITIKDKAENYSEAKPNEVLQAVVDNGEIVMVDNEEELYQEVVTFERNVMYRKEVNSFWPIDAAERFRNLVYKYL